MFSGIVEEVGEVLSVQDTADGRRLRISARNILSDGALGESISVLGTCLTVVDFKYDKNGKAEDNWFDVEAVNETLRRTKCGDLVKGSKVNLEKALKVSDRLGGHIVTGHIDTVGEVFSIVEDGFSWEITFVMDKSYAPFFVEKGSVAIDGVSLTVALCQEKNVSESDKQLYGDRFWFKVALIPHTLSVTTLGALKAGSKVNIETDVIARYVVRLAQFGIANLPA
ncbi:MAG: riboflavin synthase [Cyanobacteriota bacterium erpe_2018_sw_39hr_WHONDRS-SW48-000098_B_bin.30]|nr:riboflavin synthase [Cyanobacteriota bacterium erpe_2018_sw_39hr_WHONDRS-SW48-000098_B_bin.30]